MHAPPSISLLLGPSRYFVVALFVLLAISSIGLLFAVLPLSLRLLVWLMLSFLFVQSVCRHALCLDRHALVRLRTCGEGEMECETRAGQVRLYKVVPTTAVFPFFVVLCLAEAQSDRKRYVTVFFDAMPPADWRRLRVWLQWAVANARH